MADPRSCRAVLQPRRGGGGRLVVTFDPDEAWGTKAEHPVAGTVAGHRVRSTLTQTTAGWTVTVGPVWVRDAAVVPGDEVLVVLEPEGPQRGDLDPDVLAALEADPVAAAFFDGLAQYYRAAYLRWVAATTRRPEVRAERIAEMVRLLANGQKQRD